MLDLEALPVIDGHCHPFEEKHRQLTVRRLAGLLSMAPSERGGELAVWNFPVALMVGNLAALLGCPNEPEAVVEARNARAAELGTYVKDLFADANIRCLLFDRGFPRARGPGVLLPDDTLPVALREICRAEALFAGYEEGKDALIFPGAPNLDFAVFLQRFESEIVSGVEGGRAVAIKTVMAYYTGLAVRPVPYDDAKRAYDACLAGDRSREKEVRDYLFVLLAETAARLQVPLQVHTGHTGVRRPWPEANPILLQGVLADERCKKTTFVLLHAGYPFATEAGYLAAIFPNVYVDVSMMVPFASVGIEHRLVELMGIAPFEKVVYGSDGFGIPEINWLAAKLAKKALGTVLGRAVEQRVLGSDAAYRIADRIFWRSAEGLYGCRV